MVSPSQHGVLMHIDPDNFYAPGILQSNLFQNWRHQLACAARLGPKFRQHRLIRIENLPVEIPLIDFRLTSVVSFIAKIKLI